MYLITVTNGTQCQNKLHKAIADLLHKQNRRLLSELEATKFRDDLLDHLKGLNEKHAKCKPIRCSWWKPNKYMDGKADQNDWLLSTEGHTFVQVRMLYAQQTD